MIFDALWQAATDLGRDTVLVSGACPTGADRMCEEIWESWGGTVERHAADWDRFGKAGGFIRNEEMVNLGADKCLSFNKGKSRGTAHTTLLARQAGIDTIEYVA